MLVVLFFFPKDYSTSPGYVSDEQVATFVAPKCFGFSFESRAEQPADMGKRSVCLGWVVYPSAYHKEPKIDPKPETISTSTIKAFISKDLGISFQYDSKDTLVIQKGNIVYTYYNDIPPEQGQRVEVFNKSATDSFPDAVRKMFLKDYPDPACNVEVKSYVPEATGINYQRAEIAYPLPDETSDDPFWIHSDMCNPNYDRTNGIRYFLYDPHYPTKFFFFNIGQYAITIGTSTPWQTTFKVLN